MATPAPFDPQLDALIFELSASLEPPQRSVFEAAARAALAAAGVTGCGQAYRLLAPLQRAHWDPPDDIRVAHGPRRYRGNKLSAAPPIGAEDVRAIARARNSFQAG
jgi:hypothetical protein